MGSTSTTASTTASTAATGRASHGPVTLWRWYKYAVVMISCLILSVPSTQGRSFFSQRAGLSLVSGIFGFGNDKNNNFDNNDNAASTNPTPPVPQQQQKQQEQQQTFGRSASASLPPHLRNRNNPPYPTSSSTTTTSSSSSSSRQSQQRHPPPPPPRAGASTEPFMPPSSSQTAAAAAAVNPPNDEDTSALTTKNDLPPPPPPALPQWGVVPNNNDKNPLIQQQHQQQQEQTGPGGWMQPMPPPGQYEQDPWQQGSNTNNNNAGGGFYYGEDYLRSELDESYQREGNLMAELDNLTTSILVLEQREELHIRQLDVLTERVMDVEVQAANDRNLLATHEANCTALARTVALLQEEVQDWQHQCQEFAERRYADQEKMADLKQQIKDKENEAEEMAIAIENVRLAEKRRESSSLTRRNGGKKRGLFSWFLGFFAGTDPSYDEDLREEAYEMAKSTLLRALQSERGNVHELETVVTSLQQNNSAISEMVESRDSIIDELNNRIAVFEEDKVVLKAALRQLQKEMKEEAPKAQKMMDDLAKAEQEIKRLKADLNNIIKTHQDEIIALQEALSTKQQAISETESNLTAIGTYVDRLEERLTSFAVTRRDMEEREKKCQQMEEDAMIAENEKKVLQEKFDDLSKEQAEVKKLLEELALERTALQKENRKLYTESEFRIAEQEQLQIKNAALDNTTKTLLDELEEWKSRSGNILPELEAARAANEDLLSRLESMERLQKELEATRSRCSQLESDLSRADDGLETEKAEKEKLGELVRNQTLALAEYEKRVKEVDSPRPQKPAVHEAGQGRTVPFRILRKKLSKATGIHGLLTPPSQAAATNQLRRKLPMIKDAFSKMSPTPPPRLNPPPLPQEQS